MNKLRTLVRVGLKANFGLSVLRHRLLKEKKDLWLVPLVALAFLGLAPTIYGYLSLIKTFYRLLQPMGQQHLILTYGMLAGQVFVLIFGLYYVVSAFYFSKDLDILIPLPLKPFQVMMSKFSVILVNEYLTIAFFVLPVLIYYGILSKAGLPYWLCALVIYLLLPVIPLAVVSLLVIGMMRAVNLSRKKDALIIVGSLVLIVAGFGLQYFLNRAAGASPDPKAMVRFLTSPDGLIHRVGAVFPPSIWATKALAGGFSAQGFSNLLIFAGVSLLLFYGILIVAEKLFYYGLIGIGEISGRKKALSKEGMSRRVSSGRRPIKAIFTREWRIMNRTPIFLLNGVLVVVIVPLILVIMAQTGTGRGDNTFLLKLMTSAKPIYVILATACFMTFCSCLNGTSSSTFSREGNQFWMSKVIPVTPSEQVIAKFFHSFFIALLGIVVASGVAIFVAHLKILVFAGAFLISLAAAITLTAVGMIIDLARPLLDWTNPQKAIKQNLNVLLSMLADLGILSALGYFSVFLIKRRIGAGWLYAVLLGILILLSYASFRFLLRFAKKRYIQIEV
jgi:ABC-2 type transport system permease protein